MKKIWYFLIFTIKIFSFKYSNSVMVTTFEDRIKKGKEIIGNNSSNEQILSDYYTQENGYSKEYYMDKDGVEIYTNFFNFILSLEENEYLEYSNKACEYALNNNEKISKMSFFTKFEILGLVIFVLVVIASIWFNFYYFP